jgi:hypothetical protein
MAEEPSAASPLQSDAESRFVAILKFDLVNSTGISRVLPESDELELMRHLHRVVDEVIGTPNVAREWDGDGAALIFGYPESRIDAVEAAVRTGLRLLDAIRGITAFPKVHLDSRLAVSSGRVTIDRRSETFVRVLPFSRAKRLMELGQPGQLLIDDESRHFVDRFFEYEDRGIVELRGDRVAHAWRVVRETTIASRFAAQHVDDPTGTTIVGRDDVLSRLAALWRAALAGHGVTIRLVADAGMGKSRLARTVLSWAVRDRAMVLEIDCRPSAANSPLLPIGVLLRRTAGIGPGATDEDKKALATVLLRRLLGEEAAQETLTYLAPLFGLEREAIPLGKTREQVHAATIASVVALARAVAVREPLLVLCEDLHWADDSTAQVVRAITDFAHDQRVLVIATHWPKAVTPIDLEAATGGAEIISIEPLSVAHAASLVNAASGGHLAAEQVTAIVSRCGGVPLLLEEVARNAIDGGDSGAAARAPLTGASGVPPQLQLVVESRLDQWPQFRDIVEVASVLGREFPVAALGAMLPQPERRTAVSEALATFVDQGLFAPPADGQERVSFRHALIRDAVYETVVSRQYRQQMHSRAADVLADRYGGTADASPDVVAQHLRMARRFRGAIRVHLAAGDDTFNRGAYVEAMGHCDAVRELLDEAEGHEQDSLRDEAYDRLVLVGKIETGTHGYSAPAAEGAYRDAYGMFDAATPASARYPVIRGLATAALVRGDLATAHGFAQQGLELAGQSERADYRIDAMEVLSYTTLYYGRLADCRSWIDQCLALYEHEGGERLRYPVPQDAKTAALALLPTVAWLLGDARGAEAAIARGLQHVSTLGREFDQALLHGWIAGTRYTQRRYVDALQHAGIAYGLGKQHQFEEWEGYGGLMALLAQTALGAAPALVEQAVETLQLFKMRGIGLNGSYFLWGVARGYLNAGNVQAADMMLQAALAAASASQETRMLPEIWMLQAAIQPDRSRATALLLEAYHLAERHGAVANALRAAATIIAGSGEPPQVEWAETTVAQLDGRMPYPEAAGWMHDALSHAGADVRTLYSHPQGS